jgi:acetoacetyl-CoA synthetase
MSSRLAPNAEKLSRTIPHLDGDFGRLELVRKPLWTPSESQVKDANLTHFISFVNEKHSANIGSYSALYKWSVTRVQDFWSAMWEFAGIISTQPYGKVVGDLNKFPGAKWFPGARLNFAENLLRHRNNKPALISRSENGVLSKLTYNQLRQEVSRVADFLRSMGVRPGDRVAGYLPTIPETTIAMLGSTSIGAVWACCGAELGPTAVLDRFGQVEPKVLFAADGYFYKGNRFSILPAVKKIVEAVPSIERTVMVPFLEHDADLSTINNAIPFGELQRSDRTSEPRFEQLPADHPVYVMFTSGTTGKPKCMVQSSGGLLVNHLKELMLHADLKESDTITYITSPSWMMWTWLMSSLALGATIVLFDGNPNYPDWGAMWKLVEEEKLNMMGCSATYINYLRSLGAKPLDKFDLSSLREISQTGSPLSAEGFEWVYNNVKRNLYLNSISGGTDINGCFAGGVPIQPVYAGELQAPGLGMKINVYDENGRPVVDTLGELVCEMPTPSMPLYFWDDPQGEKYRDAYFEYYKSKGKNVWRHGDYVLLHSDTGGITMFGRSDAVLKISGVRIGTSEIYNVLGRMREIADSLAVGQSWENDQRLLLFVKLVPGQTLTDSLKQKIRKALREEASPKHVPALVIEVPDIPYTFNMKKVETAVANIVNNRPVTNIEALSNPECLEFYKGLVATIQAK